MKTTTETRRHGEDCVRVITSYSIHYTKLYDTPSRAARALLSAADDFSTVGAYLSAVDAAGYELV